MGTRWGLMPVCSGALFLLAGSAAFAVAEPAPHAPLMAAAQCMERVLRGMPGVSNIEITLSTDSGSPYPVIAYSFVDTAGRRRFTEINLFEIAGAQEPFIFDVGDIQNDPLAQRVLPLWKARCHAGFGYITSRPG